MQNKKSNSANRIVRIMWKAARLSTRIAVFILFKGIIRFFISPSAALAFWARLLQATAEVTLPEYNMPNQILIPSFEPEEVLPGINDLPVTLVHYAQSYGGMPVEELLLLCRIVRWAKPKSMFEMGTFQGVTTMQLAANCSAKIYTLDLPPECAGPKQFSEDTLNVYPELPGIKFKETEYAQRIIQLLGDSIKFDFKPYQKHIDFVFVDACHDYEFVKKDSDNAMKMLSPCGVIVWHDYATYAPGVVQALNELSGQKKLFHLRGTSLVLYRDEGEAK